MLFKSNLVMTGVDSFKEWSDTFDLKLNALNGMRFEGLINVYDLFNMFVDPEQQEQLWAGVVRMMDVITDDHVAPDFLPILQMEKIAFVKPGEAHFRLTLLGQVVRGNLSRDIKFIEGKKPFIECLTYIGLDAIYRAIIIKRG